MPPRRAHPARLLAAVNEQRAALGDPPLRAGQSAAAIGQAGLAAVLAALDDGRQPQRGALRVAVTYLLGILETRAPGHAVEVRIPPYAAIQCVAGPRHTRGTPPNVVETDAVTWVLLAAGRLGWALAVADGRLGASGQRADLSGYLPLAACGPPAGRASLD
jgi:hypothetical protein